MDASEMIDRLGLEPHPEGGWYRETWRDDPAGGDRGAGSAIYFLLDAHERSHWHRVDAAEVWHHYAGAALELAVSDGSRNSVVVLGPPSNPDTIDVNEAAPQVVVPAGAWQAARPLGGWVLVGCTVSPAFEFTGFELAEAGWTPPAWDRAGW